MGSLPRMDPIVLRKPPSLDPAWLRFEQTMPPRSILPPEQRQPIYARERRALHAQMMAPGARDFHLSQGITVRELFVPSSVDGFAIPVLRYDLTGRGGSGRPSSNGNNSSGSNSSSSSIRSKGSGSSGGGSGSGSGGGVGVSRGRETIVVYYHGGGLYVGEADSEELSCRRILKDSGVTGLGTLYSVGYRLMPQHPAATCVSDSIDAFNHIRAVHGGGGGGGAGARVLVVGSSSGGQLAALVSQGAPPGAVDGVVLRCPVTSDAFNGVEYVPERLRPMHTSAWDLSFRTTLGGVMKRRVPRDGLDRMPLEAADDVLRALPRHWIQLCTNDMLYSDGFCYVRALRDAGVQVQTDVVIGWPHTFWNEAPELPRALEADHAMLKGLAWVAGA